MFNIIRQLKVLVPLLHAGRGAIHEVNRVNSQLLTKGCCKDHTMAKPTDCCNDADGFKAWLRYPHKKEYCRSSVTQSNDCHYDDVAGHAAHQ